MFTEFELWLSEAKKEYSKACGDGKIIDCEPMTKDEMFNYLTRKIRERDAVIVKWFGKANAEGE